MLVVVIQHLESPRKVSRASQIHLEILQVNEWVPEHELDAAVLVVGDEVDGDVHVVVGDEALSLILYEGRSRHQIKVDSEIKFDILDIKQHVGQPLVRNDSDTRLFLV